ncbi:MAG: SPOR domain-containing protein [Bacteroidales bacterium]
MKRKFVWIAAGLLVMFSGCKSKKMTAVEPQEFDRPVVEAPAPDRTLEVESDTRIRAVEERFTFTRDEDRDLRDLHPYFVIIGSFRSRENANRYTQELIAKGFVPVILLSETGFHRVSVDSFMMESDARQRILQIRRSFPEHSDTWLLIRK